MSDDQPLVIDIVGAGKVVDAAAMPPAVLNAYNAALDKGNSLYNTDVDAARREWSEADRIAAPYTRDVKPKPRPAAPDPAPPEIIPDNRKAIAVCLSPDVCKSPDKPVPYAVYGTADNDHNYSPNVRANGEIIKRRDSKFTTTYGDEPGVGLGVKSGTVGDVVEPVTSSPIVRANGVPIQRHADRCTLNKGNTEGEYCYVQSTETHEAPDGKDEHSRSFLDGAKEQAGHFWSGMKATSDEASFVDGAVNKLGQWYSGESSVWGDVKSVYNSLPTGAELWEGTQNIGRGVVDVGGKVINDPLGSAKAVGNYVADGVEGAVDSVEQGYQKHGVAGALGAGTGVLAGVISPGKKLKMLKEVGEGLEKAGDIGKVAREAEHVRDAKKVEKATEKVEGSGGGRVTEKKKPTRNPCAHLAKGNPNGKGPYRGGSYSGAPGSEELGIESHHMPAKSAYPDDLSARVGGINRMPSMQMKRDDHRETNSHGWQGSDGEEYRGDQKALMETGRYRDAQAMDFRDARRIAREAGDPKRYNEAMLETAAYRKCLEQHGLLPGKGK